MANQPNIDLSASEWPRVLIVAPSVFNEYSGTGVLLSNLFRGWPKERLAAIHGDPLPVSRAVCDRFFRLEHSELRWCFPFSLIQRKAPQEFITTDGGTRIHDRTSAVRRLLKNVIVAELPWRTELSPRLHQWISDFRPEVIYALAGGVYSALAVQISDAFKIPIVSHMMDDWPSSPVSGLLGPLVKWREHQFLRRLFSRSAKHLAISDEMAVAYKTRYGHSFSVIQNPSDVEARAPESRKTWNLGSSIRLVYVGSILPQAQLQSLADVATAANRLRQKGRDIRLEVYSAWSRAHPTVLTESEAVQLKPALDEKDVFLTLTAADILILPVNFDKRSLRFIRYSMPAKVPLYLVSGTPILAYGPAEVTSLRYAIRDKWALTVTEHNVNQVMEAIEQLATDLSLREQLGKRSMSLASDRHDARIVRRAFRELIAQGAHLQMGK